jgi:hypothetical protein
MFPAVDRNAGGRFDRAALSHGLLRRARGGRERYRSEHVGQLSHDGS